MSIRNQDPQKVKGFSRHLLNTLGTIAGTVAAVKGLELDMSMIAEGKEAIIGLIAAISVAWSFVASHINKNKQKRSFEQTTIIKEKRG